MKILIATSKRLFRIGIFFTVRDMGWLGRKNGLLMRSMRDEQFDVFITADHSIPDQQNLKKLKSAVVVLLVMTTRLGNLVKLVDRINAALDQIEVGTAVIINGRDDALRPASPDTPIDTADNPQLPNG
ncbi:MAG: hypothetical protein SGI73_01205 [Chloroflexota bacterium]|nr:hypothetical protein [Chloroflexota bacterium]